MSKKKLERVVIYSRTSSKTNSGDDKDSRKRQERVCREYAHNNGQSVSGSFYDVVSGVTYLHRRPAFRELMEFCKKDDIKTILIENASRLSRDLLISEFSIQSLNKGHLQIIPVDAPESFTGTNPTNKFMRQILGSVAELEKTSLVEKLKSARDKKREETGKCEGRKSLLETRPDVIKFAKDLYRKPKGGKRMSLMKIAIDLENNEMVTSKGNRYSASSVKRMVEWKM
jgi:DNA invertase Pin-like site-specific DNA recombinase